MYDNNGCRLSVTSTRSSRLTFEWLDSRCFVSNGGMRRELYWKIAGKPHTAELSFRYNSSKPPQVSLSTKWSILPFLLLILDGHENKNKSAVLTTNAKIIHPFSRIQLLILMLRVEPSFRQHRFIKNLKLKLISRPQLSFFT